jgi:predicted Zn-dependent protease
MPESARLAQIRALVAEDPTDPMPRYMLGMEYASLGDDAAAAEAFRALADETGYVPAYHMGGQAYNRLGEVADAVALLKRGMEAARVAGDSHALGEMDALLGTLE